MFSILRPYIFSLDPEVAHDLAIKPLKANFLPKSFFSVENEEMLETSLLGKTISNPIGLAAGFDKSAEVYNSLFKFGFGFVEVGTVTPKQQLGNPKPRIFRLEKDQALINRLGFNNHGSETVAKRISNSFPDGFLGINIGPNKDTKNKADDYYICLSRLAAYAGYITINISSPNTENLRNFHDENKLKELLKSIKDKKNELKTNIPIAVKISPDIDLKQIELISEILFENDISAIIISNTSESTRDDLKNIQRHQKGGLSGKPIEQKSNLLINQFFKLLNGRIKIIGVGGIDSGKSAHDKFLSGADYIQLYTGMVFQGPNIAANIKKELKELLLRDGVKNISEIVGNKTLS